MNSPRTARLITIAVLAIVVGAIVARKTALRVTESKPAQEPPDAVYAMLESARAGNVKAYLSYYAGPLESALRESLAESTEATFGKYLKDSQAAVKGVAVSEPEYAGDSQAKVRVEFVYEDRNETQTMMLERGPAGWRIAGTEGDQRIKTLIPYGTPVK